MNKVILTVVFFLFSAHFLHAQDIIFTKEGKQIPAKVIELTDEKVSYKMFSYLDGATIITELTKIDSIVWQNGEVFKFDVKTTSTSTVGNWRGSINLPKISRRGLTHFVNDNGERMTPTQFKIFLIQNDLNHIWSDYRRARSLTIAGIGLVGAGVTLNILGYLSFSKGTTIWDTDFLGGIVCYTLSFLTIASGIPILAVGATKLSSVMRNYNSQYARKSYQQTSLQVGFTGNAIGLTLRF